jgi:hypothetical protein
MEFLKRLFNELFDIRYLFLDGGYRFKKWNIDCKKYMKYKRYKIK